MASLPFAPELASLLDRLHGASEGQEGAIRGYFEARAAAGTLSWNGLDEESHRFFADKLVALDRDKAAFVFHLSRAMACRRVVEVGTSYGVSTLYLAEAVRQTIAAEGGRGLVVGTEHEAAKASAARDNFAAAGLSDLIELREGDLRRTLKDLSGPIDLVLMDIWVEMARPAIELIAPHLRAGAAVLADNTAQFEGRPYADYFAFVREQGFSTLTLPFAGGLEMSVKL
ncbi:MAG TPA: class I SAM-dependent methyltransferase [Caulobacteraceae bacterium]|nr:class I SAM-dependent methyltransferase [Caulobacteraceae bacterium]